MQNFKTQNYQNVCVEVHGKGLVAHERIRQAMAVASSIDLYLNKW